MNIDYQTGYEQGREDHKRTVRDGLIEYFRDIRGGYSWKEELNRILEHFGYEQLVSKFRVTVTDDTTGTDVMVVIVEADDEDDAIAMVEPNVSVYSVCLTIDYQYDGDGEVEDQNSLEDEDESLAEGYCLSFVAEPYDE